MFNFFKQKFSCKNQINLTTKSLKSFLRSKGLKNIRFYQDCYVASYDNPSFAIVNNLSAKYVGQINKECSVFEFNYNGLACYIKFGDPVFYKRCYIQTKPFENVINE